MLICDCTSASVTVSFILIPWRADSRQCIHTLLMVIAGGIVVKFTCYEGT